MMLGSAAAAHLTLIGTLGLTQDRPRGESPPLPTGRRSRAGSKAISRRRADDRVAAIRLRFLVENPDELFSEYQQRGVECTPNSVRDTQWGTREFALCDLDRNALTFYRDLRSAGFPSLIPHEWPKFLMYLPIGASSVTSASGIPRRRRRSPNLNMPSGNTGNLPPRPSSGGDIRASAHSPPA
jgi:hypothetical protein